METEATRTWKLEFARSTARRREQDLFARRMDERGRDKLAADRLEDDFIDFAISTILASSDDIESLGVTLDRYDAATVEALMENQQALDETRDQIKEMLVQAYVLPDGRRVFKSKDGLRVFDEHGAELNSRDLDPNSIEDWRPRYEGYAEKIAREFELTKDREELLEFQRRVDEARERLDDDGLTKGDIAGIEADLDANMPLDVRRKQPDYEEQPKTDLAGDFGAASAKPVVGDLKLDMPEFGR